MSQAPSNSASQGTAKSTSTHSSGAVDLNSADCMPSLAVWLNNSQTWSSPLLHGWQPIRPLGRGGNGCAGLWRFLGPHPVRPGALESFVKEVAVKQAPELAREAAIMEELTLAGVKHTPEIYSRVVRAMGGGAHEEFDPKDKPVQRIVMEYFGGGNVLNIVDNDRGWFVGEEGQLWSILVCLAKGACGLEYGLERPRARGEGRKGWRGMLHADLETRNVFVDRFRPGEGGEHGVAARIAIGDVGNVEFVDDMPLSFDYNVEPSGVKTLNEQDRQRKEEIEKRLDAIDEGELEDQMSVVEMMKERLSLNYELARLTPQEQTRRRVKHGPIPRDNVWDVGKVMWELVNDRHFDDAAEFFEEYEPGPEGWEQFLAHFAKRQRDRGFSKTLMKTIATCLRHKIEDRYSPRQLLNKCLKELKEIDEPAWEGAEGEGPRARERLIMVGEGEERVWDAEVARADELNAYAAQLEGVGAHNEMKRMRDAYSRAAYSKADFEGFERGFGR